MNATDWYASVEHITDPLSEAEIDDLAAVLRSTAFKKAAAQILTRADKVLEKLATVNLLTETGVMQGIMLQTERRMCIQFFDDLLTQATQEKTNV